MEAKIRMFFESVSTFFSGGDQIPWCDRDIVAGCEREVAEAAKGESEELKSECIMRLSWALVHSRQPEDLPWPTPQKMYLLAVGYYRSGDYTRSNWWKIIAPDRRQAQTLKKTIEDHTTKDGVTGIGIAATAVGLLAGGIAAALFR
ncbi:Fis1, C-terminal tetratricopeptide repeat [Dillenia turbinata]|uniref:Fis1, C-terminal tetratricopeptide repeat n=1 Tax=Dillenia turbinata TaxID=194707 RepID=A0AAN8V141_9MAGN